MKPLSRLLTKSLNVTSPSSSPRLYSTRTKQTKSNYSKKQQEQQNVETVPPPPPRPSEIPYQAKVANSVSLIGHVAKPVQFKSSIDRSSWAGTVLTQDKDPDAPLWIPLNFEGDLAHIAACHLQEKDYVHVAGQLTRNPPEFAKEQGQTSQSGIQVMVNSLSFVEESLQRMERQTSFEQKEQVTTFSSEEYLNAEKLGTLPPHEKRDHILSKSNSTSDDFEHKDHKEDIWPDESESLKYRKKTGEKSQKSVHGVKDTETSWRDLVDNPNQWWDNRKNKINPKSPDFKQKEGGVALWLNSAPAWVWSQLELKPDDAVSALGQQNKNKDDSWKKLVEDPKKWWDNRSNKLNPKAPDFKHKETGEVLWLSSAPAWVLIALPPTKTKVAAAGRRGQLLYFFYRLYMFIRIFLNH